MVQSKDFHLENGSSQGRNLALTALCSKSLGSLVQYVDNTLVQYVDNTRLRLWTRHGTLCTPSSHGLGGRRCTARKGVQGYLTYKKTHPPSRTLP